MKIHAFREDISWEQAYESVAFTVDALSTHPTDHDLVRLAGRVASLLTDWEAIHADGRRLRRAVVFSTARARVADATLDGAIGAFAADLLAIVNNDTTSDLYKRFFTEPHEDIIAMGLDSEVPIVTLIVSALGQNTETPDALKKHHVALLDGLRLGNSALASRSDALADLGRHTARVESWYDSARSTLNSVGRALSRLASDRKLSPSWADSFFPG